jgi:hypothetical protein
VVRSGEYRGWNVEVSVDRRHTHLHFCFESFDRRRGNGETRPIVSLDRRRRRRETHLAANLRVLAVGAKTLAERRGAGGRSVTSLAHRERSAGVRGMAASATCLSRRPETEIFLNVFFSSGIVSQATQGSLRCTSKPEAIKIRELPRFVYTSAINTSQPGVGARVCVWHRSALRRL